MFRRFGSVALLTLALATPVHDAAAQDALGGALLGGVGGAIVGGAIGRGTGAVVGAVVGAGLGAAIASEGERRRNNYYAYRDGCFRQRGDGAWVRVSPRYCY
ncbi:glycine zipper domain-containing protein [Rhodoblastus sp.]|uniref:glycine zipper domain-containing protein n=1 Tax=Rhodoblastus sp. TaxID=1962975 RepID=UPI0035B03A65